MSRPADRPLRTLLLLGAIGLGAWLRLRGLGEVPLYGDEHHGLRLAAEPISDIVREFDGYGTHVMLPLLQRMAMRLLDSTIVAFRMPALLPGLLCLVLCYPAARAFVGPGPALVATMALATSPIHVYYTRFARAYSLMILLGLLLVWAVRKAHRDEWRARGGLLAVGAVAALLPYTHLSSAGFTATVGLVAVGLAWRCYGARTALRPLAVFACAAGVAVLLFLPVREPLMDYLGRHAVGEEDRPTGLLGIAALLAGGGYAGIVAGALLLGGLVGLLARRFTDGSLLGAPILGSAAFLGLTLPHGMEYAYARYLIVALPAALIVCSWALFAPFEGWVPGRWATRLGLGTGLALVTVGFLTGPLAAREPDPGSLSNTYLALRDLPAFDRPWPATPKVYARIAADPQARRIIEAPELPTRAVLLYRNYALQHGKDVLIGLDRGRDEEHPRGPFVPLDRPDLGRASGARYLVLHRDPQVELMAYWKWVYKEVWPELRNPWDHGLMSRLRRSYIPEYDMKVQATDLEKHLRASLGAPFYVDEKVAVWRLRPQQDEGR